MRTRYGRLLVTASAAARGAREIVVLIATTPTEFRIDGLWAALARLDALLERALAAADAAYGSDAAEPYRGLYVSCDDVRRAVKREAGSPFLIGAGDDAPERTLGPSRFPWLERRFALSAFDLDVLLLALAPELDTRYARIFAYLQDDVTRRRPTVELALNLLCASRDAKIDARARFASDAPLVFHELLQLIPDPGEVRPPLLTHYLKPDESVVRFLLGQVSLDPRLAPVARLDAAGTLSAQRSEQLDELTKVARQARETESALHLYFEGPPGRVKRAVAESLAATLERPLLTLYLGRAAASGASFESALALAFREAELADAVLALEELDSIRGDDRKLLLALLAARLERCRRVVILTGARPLDSSLRGLLPIRFLEPDFGERRTVWAAELAAHGLHPEEHQLDELASRYGIDFDQIRSAVEVGARESGLSATRPALDGVMRAARDQSRRELGSLARRIGTKHTWRDLVLPSDQAAQLRELCEQARHRHVVFGEWGFDAKLSLGKGLSALFCGPPGTGKTMAAEVIAVDLGLDVYKIDLSQVVSKYIGETEKNIDRLFTEARASNSILFFDECDALFGKRTQVQDAHDRYANIEVAYLLQKMDEHDGLSILATNLRQNLDVAFVRRLTFIVEFPFPDQASRRRIWEGIWPERLPRSPDLDLDFMASQFQLPGGGVKNVALAAAFFAAADGKQAVSTDHLLRATRRELEKNGRSVPRSEFGRYAEHMQGLLDGGAAE